MHVCGFNFHILVFDLRSVPLSVWGISSTGNKKYSNVKSSSLDEFVLKMIISRLGSLTVAF